MRNTLIALSLTLALGCGGSQKSAAKTGAEDDSSSMDGDAESVDCDADPSAPGCEGEDEMSADPDEGGE